VLAQTVLMLLVLFGPRSIAGWPGRELPLPGARRLVGAALIAGGAWLFCASLVRLGRRNLTPLPRPRKGAALVRSGPYRWVRHPIYGGALLAAFGWAMLAGSWLTLGYVILLLLYLNLKTRREESWLREVFPEYGEYSRRTRKLIPWVY